MNYSNIFNSLEVVFNVSFFVNRGFLAILQGRGVNSPLLQTGACSPDLGRGITTMPQFVLLVKIATRFSGVKIGFPHLGSWCRGSATAGINVGRTDP